MNHHSHCINCGKALRPSIKFCPRCGAAVDPLPGIRETSYLQTRSITITNARITIGKTTYSMANITGFGLDERPNAPASICGLLSLATAALLIYAICQQAIGTAFFFAIVVGTFAIMAGAAAAGIYELVLTTRYGRVTAYSTMDRKFARQIRTAVARAIAQVD